MTGGSRGAGLNLNVVPKEMSVRGDDRRSSLLALDGCFVHQHDRNVVFHQIYPSALGTLQALRILPVFEGLLASGADQNFQ
jgi:hypothetical protein